MLVVIALGGNALLQRGETASAEAQRHNVQTAVRAVAEAGGSGLPLCDTPLPLKWRGFSHR